MPRIIMKSPYIKPNSKTHIGNYVSYIALNGIELDYTQEELYTTILDIADGKLELADLTKWIIRHQI